MKKQESRWAARGPAARSREVNHIISEAAESLKKAGEPLNDTDRLTSPRQLVDIMQWLMQCLLLTHISPNVRFYVLITRFLFLLFYVFWHFSWRFLATSHWKGLLYCLTDTLTALCTSTLTFSPPLSAVSCVAADIISTVEFNSSGELLATGDKGGRVVVFQREQEVGNANNASLITLPFCLEDLTTLRQRKLFVFR